MENLSDDNLVKAANRGDSLAFSALVSRFENKLYRIAKTMLLDEQIASDAVQETFLRAFRGIARFRFSANVYTWLYAILRNVCRESNRKHKEQTTTEIDALADTSVNLEDSITTERRLRRVMKKIKALPERQREVFVLRVLEGLSVDETAKILKCRPGTVKAHLHRANLVIREEER